MSLVEGLQSSVMYRAGKLVNGRAIVFVLYPLIICVVSTTLLLTVEGSPPSRSDINEAEKIVGNFLRTEAGTTWLSGLAKTRSAPLTTQDLMNEILGDTRPEGRIWKAASILNESLQDQALKGTTSGSILGQAENWKDVIAHIEDQDDIICLYRKNSEETSKKADDWKRFLRTVSPGYTVHLAIDTGRKYVICLKKIDVPETTTEEVLTTQENPPFVAVSVDPSIATTEIAVSTTPEEKLKTTLASEVFETTSNGNSNYYRNNDELEDKSDYGDDNCDDDHLRVTDEDEEENYNNDNDTENEDENYAKTKYINDEVSDEEIEDNLSGKFEDYSMKPGQSWDRPDPSYMNQRQIYLGQKGRPLINFPVRISNGLGSMSSKDSECNRPIVLMVRDGEIPSVYRAGPLSRNPIQRYVGLVKLPRFSTPPGPRFKTPRTPGLSSTILQRPVQFFDVRRPSSNLPIVSNNLPRFTRPNNLGKPLVNLQSSFHKPGRQPILPQNMNIVHKSSKDAIRPKLMKYFTKSTVKPIRQPIVMSMTKPILKGIRNPLSPRLNDFDESRGSASYQRKPGFIKDSRYPFPNYVPKRIERLSSSSNFNPFTRRPINSNASWNVPVRNDSFLRQIIPVGANAVERNVQTQSTQAGREFLQSRNPRVPVRATVLGSKLQNIEQKSLKLPINVQHLPSFVNLATSPQSSFPTDRKISEQRSPLKFRGINRNKQQLVDILRKKLQMKRLDKNLDANFNPNYPMMKNVVQSDKSIRGKIGSSFLSRPCRVPWKYLLAMTGNNPRVMDSSARKVATRGNSMVCPLLRDYRFQGDSVPCPRPCDRPIKLQIVINGNVQEPLKVSVINEGEQQVEIVGSGNPKMSYGSRALREGTSLTVNPEDKEENNPEDGEEKNPENKEENNRVDKEENNPEDKEENNPLIVADVETRMDQWKEDDKDLVDDKDRKKEGDKSEEAEEEELNRKIYSVEITSDRSDKFDHEDNSTTTTDGPSQAQETEGPEIEERFLHEAIPETTSGNFVTDVNATSSSVTNSTIYEMVD